MKRMKSKNQFEQKISREETRKLGRKIPPPPKDMTEPTLSENAAYIGRTRYAFRDKDGEPVETPKDMFWRVAYYIAAADRFYQDKKTHLVTARQFYNLMATQKFIPNTPTMINSGKIGQSLSACFVLPIEDDMRSILKTMSNMAMIHKMAGGTGFSFSKLRPKDDLIGTSRGKSTGPVAFMQAYNDVCSQIRQGGVRRGANMGILHYTHPDILRFAVHKVDEFSLTNFNISISVTEEFMEKAIDDQKYIKEEIDFTPIIEQIKEAHAIRDLDLKNIRLEEAVTKLYEICRAKEDGEGYNLINPRNGKSMDKLNAKKVFNLITQLAWQYGDPGMILIDRINHSRANPTPKLGQIEATNPCAEQPLLAYDACTLGSVNLSKFVQDTNQETEEENLSADRQIDWGQLKSTIHTAIHFLDNVLDMNEYPVPQIDEMTSKLRRVGLGVMGWADMLVELGVAYNSQEGFDLAEKVMSFVQKEADNASCDLAKTRGVFPAFKGSIYDKKGEIHPRNAARTTIAPTGTISMLADCSSGIEPHFALNFAKNTIEGKRLFNTNPYFLKALKNVGIYSEEILEAIEKNHGSVKNIEEIPEELKRIFVVAGDIDPQDHVRVQAAFQKYTDNGISKTINFSKSATVEDVRRAYWLTYELGCQMITIYRDQSRIKQVLEVKKDGSYYDQLAGFHFDEAGQAISVPRKKPTPQEAWGMRVRKKADVGWVYTSVFRDGDNTPVEVFINIGKTGGYVAGAAEVTGRLASRALKYGASLKEVASDLVGISCGSPYGLGPESILSAFDAVGKSLLEISKAKQLQLPEITEQSQEKTAPIPDQSSQVDTNGQTTPYPNGYTNGPLRPSVLQQGEHNGTSQRKINGKTVSQLSLSGNTNDFNKKVLAVNVSEHIKVQDTTSHHADIDEKIIESKFSICPDCSSPVVYMEGCRRCINPTCGWSKCS